MTIRRSLLPADASGAVVLASVVAVDPGGWYPFVVAKFAAVSIAVVAAWWVCANDPGRSVDRRLALGFAALVLILAVAAVFGRDPLYAWIGTPERHLGVLTWGLFFAAFTCGGRLAEPDRLARFARWVVVSGLVVGGYALVERWRPPIATSVDTVRLGSTYGSAAFLGAALCLVLPICVAASVADRDRRWRALALVATASCTAALIGSGTRAAWLALAAAVAVAAVARGRAVVRGGAGVVAAPLAALLAGAVVAVGTAAAATERANGAASRLDEWWLGWGVVSRHLLIGVGPEGYRTALADGVTVAYERTYGREVLPDRAHNVVLDVAASGGLGAAVLYVAITVCVAVMGWRALRLAGPIEAGCAAAAIAYLGQQLFLFPVATIDPLFWLIAGSLVATPAVAAAGRTRTRGVALVAGPALAVLFLSGVIAVAADRAARVGLDRAGGTPSEAASGRLAVSRSIELRPDVIRYRVLAAQLVPRTIAGFDAAIDQLERALDVSPHDPIVLHGLADARTRLAVATGAPDDVAAARSAWQALTTDDPNCYPCQLGSGYASALAGDADAARSSFEAAARLEPDGRHEAAEALAALSKVEPRPGTDRDG